MMGKVHVTKATLAPILKKFEKEIKEASKMFDKLDKKGVEITSQNVYLLYEKSPKLSHLFKHLEDHITHDRHDNYVVIVDKKTFGEEYKELALLAFYEYHNLKCSMDFIEKKDAIHITFY